MGSELLQQKIKQLGSSKDKDLETLLREIADLAEAEGIHLTELFLQLGQRALNVGNLPLGHRLGDEVISRCQQNADPPVLADAYLLKAYLHFMEQEGVTALDNFQKSFQIMIAQGNQAGVASILEWAGDVCARAMGKLLATQLLKRAAEVYLEIGDVGGASKAYLNTGRAYFNAGYFQAAMEYCGRAEQLAIQSERDDLQTQVQRLTEKAASSLQEFQQQFPADKLQNLLTSEEGILYKDPILMLGTGEMKVMRLRVETEPVLEDELSEYGMRENGYLDQAYKLFASLDDAERMAFCLFQQGKYYNSLEIYPTALQFYRQALDLLASLGCHPFAEAAVYERMGNLYMIMGKYRDALEYNLRAAELDRQVKDVEGAAMCYLSVGVSWYHLGELPQAIQFYQDALALSELQKPRAYNNLGNAYLNLGNYLKARDFYQKALKEFESRIHLLGVARSYGNLALVATVQGDFEEAVQYNEKALSWGKVWGSNPTIQGTCHLNLGHLYYSHNEPAKALSHAQTAEEMAKQIDHWDLQRRALMIQARVYDGQNELQAAYSSAQKALDLAQSFGVTLEEEHLKLNISDQLADDYQFMVELCLRLAKYEKAYHYVEKSKSQSMVDLLAVTEVSPTVEIDPRMSGLLAEEATCLAKLRQVRTGATTGQTVVLAPGELETICARLQAIYSDLATYDPEYVFFRRREALSYSEIRQLLANRRSSSNGPTLTTLIEYFVGTENIYIFVIDSAGELHVEKVPQGKDRFNLLLENYTREVLLYRPDDFVMNTWQELGVYLLDPVAKYLQAKDHLYLVPHGFLHFLPLHALKLNGDFLIRQHTVSYAPSASVLKFLQRKGRARLEHCIAFGVALDGEDERALPTLPPDRQAMAYHMRTIFELEAREVSDLFAGQCLTGSQVTQEKVRQGCIGQDLVHFSCHGRFDGQNPLESGLKLYDSMLTTRQIFNLKLDAELVVLSACLTGLNCRRAGDDLLGLTRAFLYAGAASLLVSLWPVNSESTREFMVNFFQRLKKGDDKAAALQQAQLYLIKKYQNPFYWAPFVLVGDWEV